MIPNLLILAASALVPFAVAMVYFHPKLFGGDTWKTLARLSDEENAQAIPVGKLILSIVFNFFIAVTLWGMCVHQSQLVGLTGGNLEAFDTELMQQFMAVYGHVHLSFGHGVVHGIFAAIFFALPIIGYAYIFERKSAKYLGVNFLYWLINLALMGGIITQWGWMPVQ